MRVAAWTILALAWAAGPASADEAPGSGSEQPPPVFVEEVPPTVGPPPASTPAPAPPPSRELPPPPPAAVVVRVPPAAFPATPTDCCPHRGPIEIREHWTLAQPRLTLPPTSPDPLDCGETRLRFYVNEGSDFSFRDTSADPFVVNGFIVDAEHRTIELQVRHGLRPDLDVGVRIPVNWRGAGFMDAIIDSFHSTVGTPDNDRPAFPKDEFHVDLRDATGTLQSWEPGTGLGNVEAEVHWAFLRRGTCDGWAGALVGRVGIPTGTGVYATGSVDAGVQAVFGKQVAWWLDLYAGVGGTFFSKTHLDGLEYERWRWHGFVDAEFHVLPRLSVVIDFSGASALVTNVPQYPSAHAYVNAGLKFDVTRRVRFEIGFSEGLFNQQSTVDFGGYVAVEARF